MASAEGCFGTGLEGDRKLDLSNGSVEDGLSGVVVADAAEIEDLVILS